MQTSESGISAKSLRGRDSTRKQDASEKVGANEPVILGFMWGRWFTTFFTITRVGSFYLWNLILKISFRKEACLHIWG